MPEKDSINSFEAIKLSAVNSLKKGLAIAGSVMALAGAQMEHEAIFPDKAQAQQQCTTETSTSTVTNPDGSTQTTTTESTSCVEVPDMESPPAQQPSKPKPKQPKHDNHPDKPKKKESPKDVKVQKANSQKGFPGYNMEDSSFTDHDGCFLTAAGSSVRRETGDPNITPRSLYRPFFRSYWKPNEGVQGSSFLFDALPRLVKPYNIKVWDTGYKGALEAKKDGDEVMLLAAPGHFTTQGHYMAVRGVTPNGRKLILDDPNGKGLHGDSERKSGWSKSQLQAAGIIDYRVLHLRGVK